MVKDANKFFPTLSQKADAMFGTKVAVGILNYIHKAKSLSTRETMQNSERAPCSQLTERETAGLQYHGG